MKAEVMRHKQIKLNEKFNQNFRDQMQEKEHNIIAMKTVFNIINEQKAREKDTQNNIVKKNIVQQAAQAVQSKTLQYKQYILIYDILSINFDQIETDINNKKLNRNDIVTALTFINSIDKNIIDPYHEKILTEL